MKRKLYKAKSLSKTIQKVQLRYVAIVCVAAVTLVFVAAKLLAHQIPPVKVGSPNPPEEPPIDEQVLIEESNDETPSRILQNEKLTQHKVTHVVDGDTIDVEMGSRIERIRLIGVGTPETVHPDKPVECYGPEASNYTKSKLLGKYVALQTDNSQDKYDVYGRLLAYVYLDEKLFNYDLIYNGYAYEYTFNVPYYYQKEFKQAENYASKNKTGLWNPTICPQA